MKKLVITLLFLSVGFAGENDRTAANFAKNQRGLKKKIREQIRKHSDHGVSRYSDITAVKSKTRPTPRHGIDRLERDKDPRRPKGTRKYRPNPLHSRSSSELWGRWKENDELGSGDLTLTVGSNQTIPNPLQALAIQSANDGIKVSGDLTADLDYLFSLEGFVSNRDLFWDLEEGGKLPLVGLVFLPEDDLDIPYWFHPVEAEIWILDENFQEHYAFLDDETLKRVTITTQDAVPGVPMMYSITIEDSLELFTEDSTEHFVLKGEISLDMIDLFAGVPIPIDDPSEIFDWDDEDGLWVDTNYMEFLSDGTGRDIWHVYDIEYDEEWIDSTDFVWSTWDDTLSITQEYWDSEWNEDSEEWEEVHLYETIEVNYDVSDQVATFTESFDYCEEEELSPYACGDSLAWEFLVFGLKDVESLVMTETIGYDYDGEVGKRPVEESTLPLVANRPNMPMYGTAVLGNRLYGLGRGAAGSGPQYLRVFDISNPASPNELSAVTTNSYGYWSGNIAVKDNVAMVEMSYPDGGPRFYDISNDKFEELSVSSTVTDETVWGMYLHGNNLYVNRYGKGFRVIDVTDPKNPSLTADVGMTAFYDDINPCDIVANDSYIFVLDYSGGANTDFCSDYAIPVC